MFIKTSSIAAKEYLEIVQQPYFDDNYVVEIKAVNNKEADYLLRYSTDIYVQDIEGLATILLTEDPNIPPVRFVIQNLIKIRKGLFFGFTANSYNPLIRTYIPKKAESFVIELTPKVDIDIIRSEFQILEIFAIFYLSKKADYTANVNSHHFFELTYLESGNLEMIVEGVSYHMFDNDLLLVSPYQRHEFKAHSKLTQLSIMFAMDYDNYHNIINRSFHCNNAMKDILHQIYNYSDIHSQYHCEMLINYLKSLVTMMEYYDEQQLQKTQLSLPKEIFEDETFNEIISYVQNNIYTSLNIQEICKEFGMSRSTLQTLFKNNLNTTPKHYINEEKLELSRRLLRQRWKTVSEIADLLDYNSVHYFSRAFKKRYKINPSEYAKQNK